MASLMENLIVILNNESQEYENLLKLSETKTPIIVAGDLEELTRLTDEEQIVVGRINRLETQRQEVFNDIANVINKDVDTLMLSDLVDMLSSRPDEQQKLAKVHDRLKTVVHAVRRVNEQNRELIKEALEMVSVNLTLWSIARKTDIGSGRVPIKIGAPNIENRDLGVNPGVEVHP